MSANNVFERIGVNKDDDSIGHIMTKHITTTTQFIDGDPNGIRVSHRILSTMQSVFIPRPLLARAKKLPNLPSRGIYYLISDEDGSISQLYVGQTTQGINRLDDHNVKKDFWNKAILFLSDDNQSFSLDNISALEKYAIGKAASSKRYDVDNKIDPRYEIDEYQKPVIEQIYDEIAFSMATFGYQLEDQSEALKDMKIFHTTRRGVKTKGVYRGETFDLLEGSEVDLSVAPHNDSYERMRRELIEAGDIQKTDEGRDILQKTLSFKSPSGAADFALGGSNNGWTEWKDENKVTLDALYR